MKIAIHSPYFLFADPEINYNGYDLAFFEQYKPAIYFPGWRRVNLLRAYKAIKQLGINPAEIEFLFTERELNKKADTLIGFCGRPDLTGLKPPKKFRGMKVFHVMDYVFCAKKANQALEDARVDYLMGYTEHDKYCPFFQTYYPKFTNKVLAVPFGFGKRFTSRTPFLEREKKCIAAGSVNPVDDPEVKQREELNEYRHFYKQEQWTHRWRKKLSDHENELNVIMDSVLPKFPQTKNLSYNAPQLFDKYQLFANDEGLMVFPPARTYEGVAAGSVLVAAEHPIYRALGFEDGVNCILHKPLDIEDFKNKILHYLKDERSLETIAEKGKLLVRTRYSHEAIAQKLHKTLLEKYIGRKQSN